MAKVTITIEDKLNGNVSIQCDPKESEIYGMINSGTPATAAHVYALAAYNRMKEVSSDAAKKDNMIINVPSVGRI